MEDTSAKANHTGLDAEIDNIMKNKSLDDNEKWKLYEQVLRRSLNSATINRQPISLPIVDSAKDVSPEDEMVESLPELYKGNTKTISRSNQME